MKKTNKFPMHSKYVAYQKAEKVIDSIITSSHIIVAQRYIRNHFRLYHDYKLQHVLEDRLFHKISDMSHA